MADFNINKNNLPLWKGGTGKLTVHVSVPNPLQPLPVSAGDLVGVDFDVNGGQNFTFGTGNTAMLGIKAHAGDHLTPIWAQTAASHAGLLNTYGLDQYFAQDANKDKVLLALQIGAGADLSASGSFPYSYIGADATLNAGGDVAYAYIRPLPSSLGAAALITDYFSTLRLPVDLDRAPEDGEVIHFEYGGYLKVGAGLSFGYQIQGSPSFDIEKLRLSETYDLSILGSLSLAAGVAGRFAVEVSAGRDSSGTLMPGWARVVVKKSKSSSFSFAADVSIAGKVSTQGLPLKAEDFLGAALGTNVKNWLNVLDEVRALTTPGALEAKLDSLARNFIETWIGKGLNDLTAASPEFVEYLGKLKTVVDDYKNLDNDAITLFDRYYNAATGQVDGVLTDALNKIKGLVDWNGLTGGIVGEFATVLRQLTGGDPLSAILGGAGPFAALQTKVDGIFSLIQDKAHTEIRGIIALAKSKFGLDGLFKDLGQIDTVPKIQQLLNTKAVAFADRVIGVAIEKLDQAGLAKALAAIQKAVTAWDSFTQRLYDKFKAALNQSFSFKLHSEYSRADERTALVDVCLNMTTDQGKALMRKAGLGDFADVLLNYDPAFVRLNQGVLSHNASSKSAFRINIEGWHKNFIYSGFDKVMVNTEQQIRTDPRGALTVYSTIDLDNQQQRLHGLTGKEQKVFSDFTLRILGETRGVPRFDPKTQQYLIDTIAGYAARYQLEFSSMQATPKQLGDYLSYAADFGLANSGATLPQVLPTLQDNGGNLGEIHANYDVRYTGEAVQGLLQGGFTEQEVRKIIRKLVLETYLRDHENLVGVAWCYWSPSVYKIFQDTGGNFVTVMQNVAGNFDTIPALGQSPFASVPVPAKFPQLDFPRANLLSVLYNVENGFVSALTELSKALTANPVKPADVEKALMQLGKKLNSFNWASMAVNSTFAVFDKLIALRTVSAQARASSLTLVSKAATVDSAGTTTESDVTKVFVSVPQTASAASS